MARDEYYEEEYRGSSLLSKPIKLIFSLALRIIFSPLVVLILAYIYYEDTRKAFLVSLIVYTAMTLISLVMSLLQIFLSMMTFNLFKFIRKSFKVVTMTIALVIYWLGYIFYWGTNFTL